MSTSEEARLEGQSKLKSHWQQETIDHPNVIQVKGSSGEEPIKSVEDEQSIEEESEEELMMKWKTELGKKWGLPKEGKEAQKSLKRKFLTIMILQILDMTGMLVGGILSKSLVIIGEAVDNFSDFFSWLVSFLSVWLASRKKTPNSRFTFGMHRFQILGALISVILIWVFCVLLIINAINRFVQTDWEVLGLIMLILSWQKFARSIGFIGILTGCSCFKCFSSCCKKKAENKGTSKLKDKELTGLNSSPPIESSIENQKKDEINSLKKASILEEVTKQKHEIVFLGEGGEDNKAAGDENINLRTAIINVGGDILRTMATIVASALIQKFPNWKYIDPGLSLFLSLLILLSTLSILKEIVLTFLESAPSELKISQIVENFKCIKGVTSVHDLHIWTIVKGKVALSVHLVTTDSQENTLIEATKLCRRYGIFHTTVQCSPESFLSKSKDLTSVMLKFFHDQNAEYNQL